MKKNLNTRTKVNNSNKYANEKRESEGFFGIILGNPKLRFVIIFALVLAAYGIYMLVASFMINKENTIVTYGKIELMEEVEGYVFRDESVVEANESKSIKPIVAEGNRAKKDEEVATYYESDYETYEAKIQELDQKINQAMANKPDIFSNDAKILEDQILSSVQNAQNITSVETMQSTKTKINELVQKKAKIVGDLSPAGSHIKELIEERSKLEQQANTVMQKITASRTGLVSYYVDGLENVFTLDKLDKYTVKELKDFVESSKKESNKVKGIRIVDNFCAYILIPYDAAKAETVDINKTVYLRFPDKSTELIPATITGKKADGEKTILIVKIKNYLEYITNYRDINFELVWWQYEGMKIPKQAIYEENNEKCINVNRYGEIKQVQIKILKENEDFCIIDNYSYNDWLEKGLAAADANSKESVRLYDEIVVNYAK